VTSRSSEVNFTKNYTLLFIINGNLLVHPFIASLLPPLPAS